MNVEKESILATPWRLEVLRRLDVVLIAFELVLSAAFLFLSILTGNPYFRGVGIGLAIAWVTSTVAYLFKRKLAKS